MNAFIRPIVFAAGLLGFLGVALGALGAHALKETLAAHGMLETWRTAVLYQLLHSVALLALAGWREATTKTIRSAAWCFIAGVVLFSGSLYWLAFGGPINLLWPVTPLGGLSLLAGWALIVAAAWKTPRA
jgi:uncharacterized membrane protein YgdD (TMEM256/DUF423 family)